jgi:hypothetical protein
MERREETIVDQLVRVPATDFYNTIRRDGRARGNPELMRTK